MHAKTARRLLCTCSSLCCACHWHTAFDSSFCKRRRGAKKPFRSRKPSLPSCQTPTQLTDTFKVLHCMSCPFDLFSWHTMYHCADLDKILPKHSAAMRSTTNLTMRSACDHCPLSIGLQRGGKHGGVGHLPCMTDNLVLRHSRQLVCGD